MRCACLDHSEHRPENSPHGCDFATFDIPSRGKGIVVPEEFVRAIYEVYFQESSSPSLLQDRTSYAAEGVADVGKPEASILVRDESRAIALSMPLAPFEGESIAPAVTNFTTLIRSAYESHLRTHSSSHQPMSTNLPVFRKRILLVS